MSTQLATLSDMQTMADAVAKSGLFGMKTADQALALMLVAQSEGCHPATITQDYDIIQGRACRKTHSVMARFQQMGGTVEWHNLTETVADATFSHAAGGSLRIQWTFEQAKKAGLTNKDNWKNYPRSMLRARVIAEGVRAVYPAAIGGMLVSEEAQDIPFNTQRTGTSQTDGSTNPEQDAFEAEHLQSMRDAAMDGMQSLNAAFALLPKGELKTAFWLAHGDSLEKAASESVVIEVQPND